MQRDLEPGDVVWVDLNPARGAEKRKRRPCLVLQKRITPLELITVLPVTDDNGRRHPPFFATIGDIKKAGLHKKSVIDCYQIRTLSLERCSERIGGIGASDLDRVKSSVALILGIHSYHVVGAGEGDQTPE